jgi:hypothetical protein
MRVRIRHSHEVILHPAIIMPAMSTRGESTIWLANKTNERESDRTMQSKEVSREQ